MGFFYLRQVLYLSHEQIDRNREIRAKHKLGMSYYDLAREYGVSETRIRQIDGQVRYQELHQTPDVEEIKIACEKLGATPWMNGRIQNALRKRHLGVKNRWRKLTRIDILELDNIGTKTADIIEYAQRL